MYGVLAGDHQDATDQHDPREPVNVLNAQANGGHEQHQTDQPKQRTESSQAKGLNAEKRMLRHAGRVKEARRRQKKESNPGEKREDELPRRSGQQIRKGMKP